MVALSRGPSFSRAALIHNSTIKMKKYSDEERIAAFWSKVNKNGPIPLSRPDLGHCWLWTGCISDGYGMTRVFPRRMEKAHIFAFELTSAVPVGCELDHLCRTTNCVNPDHLEPVPHRVNVLRGAGIMARKSQQTHCKHGHLLDSDNTIRRNGTHRQCRTCKNKGAAKRRIRIALELSSVNN